MLSIIPTLMVLSFFFNSRILQTGPNQFVENQKQNQDNTGRFGMKNLPKRLVFLPKRPVPNDHTITTIITTILEFRLEISKLDFC